MFKQIDESLRDEFINFIAESGPNYMDSSVVQKNERVKPDNENVFYIVNQMSINSQIEAEALSNFETKNDWLYFYEKINDDISKEIEFQIDNVDAFYEILSRNFADGPSDVKLICAKIIALFLPLFDSYAGDILEFCKQSIQEETSQVLLTAIIQNFPTLDESLPEIALQLKGEYFVTAIRKLAVEGVEIPNHIYIIQELLKIHGSDSFLTIIALSPTFEELVSSNAINHAISFFEQRDEQYKDEDYNIAAKFLACAYRSEGGSCPAEDYLKFMDLLENGRFPVKNAVVLLLSKLLPDEKEETLVVLFENNIVEMVFDLIDSLNDTYTRSLKYLLRIIYVLISRNKQVVVDLLDENMLESIQEIVDENLYTDNIKSIAEAILAELQ